MGLAHLLLTEVCALDEFTYIMYQSCQGHCLEQSFIHNLVHLLFQSGRSGIPQSHGGFVAYPGQSRVTG